MLNWIMEDNIFSTWCTYRQGEDLDTRREPGRWNEVEVQDGRGGGSQEVRHCALHEVGRHMTVCLFAGWSCWLPDSDATSWYWYINDPGLWAASFFHVVLREARVVDTVAPLADTFRQDVTLAGQGWTLTQQENSLNHRVIIFWYW
jgi:hypothetical protein